MNFHQNGRYRISERQFVATITALLLYTLSVIAATTKTPSDSSVSPTAGYRIDEPGTITFTVGVKISGKVEKPQVMIFLPKEKTLYREEVFTRSFRDELMQPLPFTPQTDLLP